MRTIIPTIAFALLLAPVDIHGAEKEQPAAAQEESKKPELTEFEREFAEKLSGATMRGSFTVDGRDKPPQEERYEIAKISKLRDDYWVFNARIKYGDHDLTVPITLKVLWAGDTPVISLTDLTIPGLGTFTARVMIYGDRYAGTWQHGKVGGHLFGRIETGEQATGEKNGQPRFPVNGLVTVNGLPLAKGKIVFEPASGEGRAIGAKIKNGRYSLEVPAGKHRLRINGTGESIPAKYNKKSKIHCEVSRGKNTVHIELTAP